MALHTGPSMPSRTKAVPKSGWVLVEFSRLLLTGHTEHTRRCLLPFACGRHC